MPLSLRNLLETNLALKLVSCFFGLTFWLIFSAEYQGSLTLSVPLCFYGNEQEKIIHAPESLVLTLAGKRSSLYHLDLDRLALHLNTDELDYGEQLIEVNAEKLLLPNHVKVLHWSPSNLIVTVNKKNQRE